MKLPRWRLQVPFEVALTLATFYLLPYLVVLTYPDYWRVIRSIVFPWCSA